MFVPDAANYEITFQEQFSLLFVPSYS